MKHTLIILLSSLLALPLFAETKQEIAAELKWTDIQSWNIDTQNVDVVSFENARYRLEDRLPYYWHEITVSPNYNYNVEINNAQYIQLSAAEAKILRHASFSKEAEVKTKTSKTNNQLSLELEVLPFVEKNGKQLKLKHFNLTITQTPNYKRNRNVEQKHSFASSSVLSKGRFVKVQITESGIYKLTYADLKKKGLNPQNIRLFGYGGGVLEEDFSKPIIDDLPEIAIHDTGDAILFYAQGVTKWEYDEKLRMFRHKNNPYSKHGYYFVTDENIGEKKRIPLQKTITAENANEIREFTDYKIHEKELINLVSSGREFFGEKFQGNDPSKNFSFDFPNIVKERAILVNLDVAATYISEFTLNLNSTNHTAKIEDFENSYHEIARTTTRNKIPFPANSDKLNFQLNFNPMSGHSTRGYLNFIEINATRELIMQGSSMYFHNRRNIAENSFNHYHLKTKGANSKVQIWEITDPLNPTRVSAQNSNTEISFTDSANKVKSYIAIDLTNATSFPSAKLLNDVVNQNIHGMSSVDMIIITHPRFIKQAEQLALAHKKLNDLSVGIITTEEAYNEFSSGTPDATAYRKAAKFFFEKENAKHKLKYLLLFGQGTFDNRQIQHGSPEPLLLTYQSENSVHKVESYVTDDFFGLLEDGKGKNHRADKIDIAIGRFPVTSVEEAKIVVQKTIDYMYNKDGGAWQNTLCFMADDGDEAEHMKQADKHTQILAQKHPELQIKKILSDAFQKEKSAKGDTYPSAKSYFKKLWNSGLLVFSYMGHAYPNGLAREDLLTVKDVEEMNNKTLPLFVAGACGVSSFDDTKESIGGKLLLIKRGGAIATFSAARTVYANPNARLLNNFYTELFKKENGQERSIAEVIRIAKNMQGREINKLSFIYLGDPALKLNSPTKYKVKTKTINGNSIESTTDTLRALSTATIEGEILNEKGELAHEFNGYLHATVFDKKEKITSLNNDNGKNGAITFEDYPSTLFSGKAKVEGGKFKYTFLVPKNIRYNYGKGRIVHVAWDEQKNSGHGFCENFILGGSSKNVIEDKNGPEIISAYLNDASFVNGTTVNESPLFIAKIFDENGINTSGTGIGQDATITILSNNNDQYNLNDYFVYNLNSYTSGTISFKIPPLPEGEHTLRFKIWDLQNNSTTKEIKFNVATGLTPEFLSVKSYPNPANEFCYFELEYKSEDFINENVNVDIFDVSGRLIHSFSDVLIDRRVRWDLNSGAQKTPPGLYIYRVYLKKENKILRSKANKLIVKY